MKYLCILCVCMFLSGCTMPAGMLVKEKPACGCETDCGCTENGEQCQCNK